MKKKGIAVMCLTALLLSGCGAVMPDMTDEEASAIGEYAAIKLLKYDASSRSRLVDFAQLEEQGPTRQPEVRPSEPEQPSAPEPETPVIDNTAAGETSAESMESFLELPEGLRLIYTGYEQSSNYQEDPSSYFALEASEGKELLILHFSMQNDSDGGQPVDLFDSKATYRVTVNGNYSRTALTTMLSNDLTTYMGTVSAGGAEDVVVLIEVEPEKMGSVDSLTLNLKKGSQSYVMRIL